MERFIGRKRELALLRRRLERVRADGTGSAVAIRGRRQVGKSRLIQTFCDQVKVPYLFYTGIKGASPKHAIESLCAELVASNLPTDPELVVDPSNGSWTDAFRMLASLLPDEPSVIVLDELPWLSEQDSTFDGALQNAWDRLLSRRPVLLILAGSDIHMMERLTAYDRPFYGRADTMVLGPLNPAELADALMLSSSDALDAHLVTGGLPGIVRTWPYATSAAAFIRSECEDPAAPLFSVPEAALMSEFPSPDTTRRVLDAMGGDPRTHANIASTVGGRDGDMASGALSPILRRLVREKHVVAVDAPLSTKPGKPALYRIADSNLRLYLAALRDAQEQARRGRPTVAAQTVQTRWTAWRGRAIEPLVREALWLAATGGSLPWSDVSAVGGWWNRQFDPEIDLVGADRGPVAGRVRFAGSIKWLSGRFDRRDLGALRGSAPSVPGFDPAETALVAVSRSGFDDRIGEHEIDVRWGPDEVVGAWR